MTDGQRRSVAGADYQIVFTGKDEPERERTAQLRQRRSHRLDRLDTLLEKAVDEMHDDLGIGFGLEDRAVLLEPFAQLAKILDNAVVNNGDAIGGVRMRVVLGRLAVGGPAGVPDPGMALRAVRPRSRFSRFFSLPSARRRAR